METDAVLDCVGLYCPMPIALMSKKIKELKAGQVIEILADDLGIKEDLPAWCKATGNEFLKIEDENGTYRGFVKKTKD
ncbi:sulfurtransferase TusA family protein [Chloroflexota bacterium]